MKDKKSHWEDVYQTKASDAVSWYKAHLDISLAWIKKVALAHASQMIDVGGGSSTLVDDLLLDGYANISVLDISATAVEATKQRLGEKANQVAWFVGDVTEIELPTQKYDVWHDRAVFHFLTETEQRQRYIGQLLNSVKDGGYALIATFGMNGPLKCSGLDVVRYDVKSMHKELGDRFQLIDHATEMHETPFGTTQQFQYCLFRILK